MLLFNLLNGLIFTLTFLCFDRRFPSSWNVNYVYYNVYVCACACVHVCMCRWPAEMNLYPSIHGVLNIKKQWWFSVYKSECLIWRPSLSGPPSGHRLKSWTTFHFPAPVWWVPSSGSFSSWLPPPPPRLSPSAPRSPRSPRSPSRSARCRWQSCWPSQTLHIGGEKEQDVSRWLPAHHVMSRKSLLLVTPCEELVWIPCTFVLRQIHF